MGGSDNAVQCPIVQFFRSSGARFCGLFFWTLVRLEPGAGVTEVCRSITFLKSHIVKIEEIEAITGISFLGELAAENPVKPQAIRRFKAQSMWQTEERVSNLLDYLCDSWESQ